MKEIIPLNLFCKVGGELDCCTLRGATVGGGGCDFTQGTGNKEEGVEGTSLQRLSPLFKIVAT